jgi:alpha-tubulin suppressor-like RCC1 family protein
MMAMMGIVYAAGGNSAGQLGDQTTKSRPFFGKIKPLQAMPPVTAVAAGSNHSLALCVDGTVRAWGKNDRGQLGDSTTSDRHEPVTVLTPSVFQGNEVVEYKPWAEVIAVAAGSRHSMALRADGTVWAWGANEKGQLGDGTTTDWHIPVAVLGVEDSRALDGIIALAAGSSYSVALRADGTVWAWGANEKGQLGDGTTTDRPRPVLVKGLTRVSAIAARGTHTLALIANGLVTSWGSNNTGQLGDGTTTDRPTPALVMGPGDSGPLDDVAAIAAGVGYSLALRANGTVWSWGGNKTGQLGDGTTHTHLKPVKVVTTDGSPLTGVTTIAAGAAHSIALQGFARVFAWGSNNGGRLGDGTTTDRHTPVLVATQNTVGAVAIAAGQIFSLVVAAWCNVRAWGSNSKGQLASKTGYFSEFVTEPFAVASAENYNLCDIAAGEAHSLALRPGKPGAFEDTTHVRSWGWNANGQLGDGGNKDRPTPLEVLGLTGVKAVAAGDRHSLALMTDGTVWAWGANGRGQLGIDSTDDRWTPVHVDAPTGDGLLSSVVAIAARGAQSLALRADGTVWAWGANDRGQLGDGTLQDRHRPVAVQKLVFTKVVAAGGAHGLALLANGKVWAWGAGDRGQLGNTAFPVDSANPVEVSGKGEGSGALRKALAAGNQHSLALCADGTVWAWGANDRGQLGDGTTTDRPLRVQVSAYRESYEGDQAFEPLRAVWAIAAGGEHSLAIDARGKAGIDGGFVRCWGANDLGQLGNGTTMDRNRASAAWPKGGPALRDVAAISAGPVHSLAVGLEAGP